MEKKIHTIRQTFIVEGIDDHVVSIDVNVPLERSRPADIEVLWFGANKMRHTFKAARQKEPEWWRLSWGGNNEADVHARSEFYDLMETTLTQSQVLRAEGKSNT